MHPPLAPPFFWLPAAQSWDWSRHTAMMLPASVCSWRPDSASAAPSTADQIRALGPKWNPRTSLLPI